MAHTMRRTRIGSPTLGLSTHHVAVLALRGPDPRKAISRPVLPALELATFVATVLLVLELRRTSSAEPWLIGQVALWLWLGGHGNMVSLDDDPMRLIEAIRDSRRLAAVRRALTGLALGADIAKCLFVLCAAFTAWTAGLSSGALAACMFGALVILILAPPAVHMARLPSFARRRTDIAA